MRFARQMHFHIYSNVREHPLVRSESATTHRYVACTSAGAPLPAPRAGSRACSCGSGSSRSDQIVWNTSFQAVPLFWNPVCETVCRQRNFVCRGCCAPSVCRKLGVFLADLSTALLKWPLGLIPSGAPRLRGAKPRRRPIELTTPVASALAARRTRRLQRPRTQRVR